MRRPSERPKRCSTSSSSSSVSSCSERERTRQFSRSSSLVGLRCHNPLQQEKGLLILASRSMLQTRLAASSHRLVVSTLVSPTRFQPLKPFPGLSLSLDEILTFSSRLQALRSLVEPFSTRQPVQATTIAAPLPFLSRSLYLYSLLGFYVIQLPISLVVVTRTLQRARSRETRDFPKLQNDSIPSICQSQSNALYLASLILSPPRPLHPLSSVRHKCCPSVWVLVRWSARSNEMNAP